MVMAKTEMISAAKRYKKKTSPFVVKSRIRRM